MRRPIRPSLLKRSTKIQYPKALTNASHRMPHHPISPRLADACSADTMLALTVLDESPSLMQFATNASTRPSTWCDKKIADNQGLVRSVVRRGHWCDSNLTLHDRTIRTLSDWTNISPAHPLQGPTADSFMIDEQNPYVAATPTHGESATRAEPLTVSTACRILLWSGVWSVLFFFGSAVLIGLLSAVYFNVVAFANGPGASPSPMVGLIWALGPMLMGPLGFVLGLAGRLPGTRRAPKPVLTNG